MRSRRSASSERRCRCGARSPAFRSSGCCGRMSAPRTAVRMRIRITAAIPRRVASLRVKRAIASTRWVSIGQCVPVSWAARSILARAAATVPLTTLPSARPRVRGASQPMTLPRSRAEDAPVARIPSSTSVCDLRLGHGLGEVVAEDRDLGLLLGREVLAAGGPVRLDQFLAGLDLAREDGQRGVIAEWRAVALLGVVERARGHTEDIATQRITAPHGGSDISLDAISKGHRFVGYLGR